LPPTIIGHFFAKWIKSWRDLPVLVNQWANIIRWELEARGYPGIFARGEPELLPERSVSPLADALRTWRRSTNCRAADDWVFASPAARGQKPYWGQCLMRTIIRPAAARIGLTQRIGWHTFRHTYSSLLRPNRTDIKVMQELLRYASSRVTLDAYTQAVTFQKRKAQSNVIRLLRESSGAAG
jgi:hypothetical protein